MRLSFIIGLCLCGLLVSAQYAYPQAGFNLAVAIPIHEFAEADSGKQAYFGLGGEFTFPILEDSPVRFGLDFRYFWMGNRNKSVDVTDSIGFLYNLTTKVGGSMMPIHAHARFDFMNTSDYPILPYFGGFAGIKVFKISNKLEFDHQDGEEPYIEFDHSINVTGSYGFEVGMHVRVTDYILIDARYERAFGGWAKYLDVSSVRIDDEGNASYSELNTRTDVDIISLGAIFNFK